MQGIVLILNVQLITHYQAQHLALSNTGDIFPPRVPCTSWRKSRTSRTLLSAGTVGEAAGNGDLCL